MSNHDPNFLHEAVQRALAVGDFETARQLSPALGQAIVAEACAAAPAARAACVRQALSRLEEHLSLARVLRAHLASELQANAAACRYHSASGDGHSWHFEA
jgi:hypothetical protein